MFSAGGSQVGKDGILFNGWDWKRFIFQSVCSTFYMKNFDEMFSSRQRNINVNTELEPVLQCFYMLKAHSDNEKHYMVRFEKYS